MSNQEICFLPATELTRRIRAKELSATEVMEAHLTQIERVNPKVNAIVTFLPEQALEQARAAALITANRISRMRMKVSKFGAPGTSSSFYPNFWRTTGTK